MTKTVKINTAVHSQPPTPITSSPLFVHQSGVGPPLLLIHGLMVSGAMYQPVLPALSAHYRLIVPDLRRHGHSRALPGPCTFANNMLSRREWVEGMLAPWLVRILGMRRLARLVITSSGGPRMSSETEHWFQEILASNDKGRMVKAVEAMEAFDSRPWLHQIACPTLVIAGAEDTAVPLAHAQMLAQGIPGAQLRVVDGAGHTPIWTHTDIFLQNVEAFLASANRPSVPSV